MFVTPDFRMVRKQPIDRFGLSRPAEKRRSTEDLAKSLLEGFSHSTLQARQKTNPAYLFTFSGREISAPECKSKVN